jgi:hypothetical protein
LTICESALGHARIPQHGGQLISFLSGSAIAADTAVPAEGSKLVKAFLQIEDFKRRADVIKMIEEASALKNGQR